MHVHKHTHIYRGEEETRAGFLRKMSQRRTPQTDVRTEERKIIQVERGREG